MPSKKSSKISRSKSSRANPRPRLYGPAPLASLGWLLGAGAVAVVIGTLAAYFVLGIIFYQNQAMLLFHPSRNITTTPASVGLSYQQIAFAPGPGNQPQLTGWWIPAEQNRPQSSSTWRNSTLLYLHGATGSLSATIPQLKALHNLGINVFAIDYRGFGNSANIRPTEQTASADAVSAWKYLTGEKHIQPTQIVVYSEGAGTTFAAHLATQHTVAGLVLAEISPTAHAIFQQDPRARLLPLFLLANQHLNPAPDLKRLNIPKLFLDWPKKSSPQPSVTSHDYQLAASPKHLTSLPGAAPSGIAKALHPFLAQVLPAAQ